MSPSCFSLHARGEGCDYRASGGGPCVVSFEPQPQACFQLRHGGVRRQIDLLVFHSAAESLDENVIHPPALAVHADLNPHSGDFSGPFRRCELAALVGVEDVRQVAFALLHGAVQGPLAQFIVAVLETALPSTLLEYQSITPLR